MDPSKSFEDDGEESGWTSILCESLTLTQDGAYDRDDDDDCYDVDDDDDDSSLASDASSGYHGNRLNFCAKCGADVYGEVDLHEDGDSLSSDRLCERCKGGGGKSGFKSTGSSSGWKKRQRKEEGSQSKQEGHLHNQTVANYVKMDSIDRNKKAAFDCFDSYCLHCTMKKDRDDVRKNRK